MHKSSLQYILLSFVLGCETKTGNAIFDHPNDSGLDSKDPSLPANWIEQCPTGRWCWQEPQPTGDHYVALWAVSDTDVWAVTKNGTVIHYDGSNFEIKYRAQENTKRALIWGQDKNNLWIRLTFDGRWGRALYWNGKALTEVDLLSEADNLIGGTENGLIWAFSEAGRYIRSKNKGSELLEFYDSGKISDLEFSNERILSMMAFTDNDVWVMSDAGNLFHWDGQVWSTEKLKLENDEFVQINGVWGASSNDIWAVHEIWMKQSGKSTQSLKKTIFRHFNGTNWEVKYEETGTIFTTDNPETLATKIVGRSSQSIRVISTNGETSWEWDGTKWNSYKKFNNFINRNFTTSISATSTQFWYAGSFGDLGILKQSEKTPVSRKEPQNGLLSASMPERNNVWTIVGSHDTLCTTSSTVRHWDGKTWTVLPSIGPKHCAYQILALSSTDVWVGGNESSTLTNPEDLPNGFLAHWNGTTWSKTTFNRWPGAFPLWASASNDVWANSRGNLLRWNGTDWNSFQLPTKYMKGTSSLSVSGASAKDIWIAGSYQDEQKILQGFIVHWDGQNFTDYTNIKNVSSQGLRVYTVATNDVWAVDGFGYGPSLHHWNGQNWTKISTPTFSDYQIWGTGPNNVWIAGNIPDENGYYSSWTRHIIFHWDGTLLRQEQNLPATGFIQQIFGSGSDDIWIATQGGLLRSAKPQLN